ncbi:hypothetical protein Tco_1223189 [Tanacetum coccineum]
MSKVLQERGIGGLPGSTEPNPRDHVKSISTAKVDSSEIRCIGCSPYAVSGSQHRSMFSEIVPFPRRLQNYYCDDWREAQDVKNLEAYDHTLPQKKKNPGSFTLSCFIHTVCFDKALDKDEGKSHAGFFKIDIPAFRRRFSIISGFTIIDDDDMTKDVIIMENLPLDHNEFALAAEAAPNNNNGWIEWDLPLVGEMNEPMVDPEFDEEEMDDDDGWEEDDEWLMAPVTP